MSSSAITTQVAQLKAGNIQNQADSSSIYSSGQWSFKNSTAVASVTITDAGNVGIGTASPAYKIHSTGTIGSGTTGTNGFYGLKRSSDGAEIGSLNTDGTNVVLNTGGATAFQTAGTERMRINANGSVSMLSGLVIGSNANPGSAVQIGGAVLASGAGTHFLKWNNISGTVTYDTSSRLVKDQIEDIPYGLASVLSLQPRKYFRTDDQKEEIGFIADEVHSVIPEVVPMVNKSLFTRDEQDTELIPGGVNYDKLTAVLVKAIQEQQAQIESLKAEVAALKAP